MSQPPLAPSSTIILGIDPGLRFTGWGVIASQGSRLSYIACGRVQPDTKLDLAPRLRLIYEGLREVIARYAPDEVAVEETFVNKDPRSALKLGAARGVAMLVPALHDLRVSEYAPNLIKKTIVGAGHAEKEQIRLMVKMLLPSAAFKHDDEADALAIAITHAQHRGLKAMLATSTK